MITKYSFENFKYVHYILTPLSSFTNQVKNCTYLKSGRSWSDFLYGNLYSTLNFKLKLTLEAEARLNNI
jgi:hypothetical protein